MKTTVGLLGSLPALLAGLLATSGALAEDEQTSPSQAPPPPPYQTAPAPPAMPPAPPLAGQVPQEAEHGSASGTPQQAAQGPATGAVQGPVQGQWLYTDRYGWIWVPAGSEATTLNAQPYVYLYAPTYGWTWFVSPWGFGPYHAGPWVRAHGAAYWHGPGLRAAYPHYQPYVGPRVWYGYHGVTTHAYQPSFGSRLPRSARLPPARVSAAHGVTRGGHR
jgi:hypothetical protein